MYITKRYSTERGRFNGLLEEKKALFLIVLLFRWDGIWRIVFIAQYIMNKGYASSKMSFISDVFWLNGGKLVLV